MSEREELTKLTAKQLELLQRLYKMSKMVRVYTVFKSQDELARELGVTRQALNIHLRRLKEFNLIRTGRGFIDLTEKALKILGISTSIAIILVRIKPEFRETAYRRLRELPVEKLYRVTGKVDAVMIVSQEKLKDILDMISKIEGIEETITLTVFEVLKE